MSSLDAAFHRSQRASVLPRRVANGPAAWMMGATLGLASAVAGCGAQQAVVLPHKAAAQQQDAPAATASQRPLTARQQVVAAYTGYWLALGQALDSRSAPQARAILARYVPPASIPSLVSGFETDWARGEIQFGGPVPHIQSVQVSGRHAAVHDCADFSHAGLQDASTGQVTGSLGDSRVNMISTLVRSHGRWLVSNQVPVVVPCAP
jgi:hypothetical protein